MVVWQVVAGMVEKKGKNVHAAMQGVRGVQGMSLPSFPFLLPPLLLLGMEDTRKMEGHILREKAW